MGCFMYKVFLNWVCFRGLDISVLSLWICSEEGATVFFSPTTTNIDSEILSNTLQV